LAGVAGPGDPFFAVAAQSVGLSPTKFQLWSEAFGQHEWPPNVAPIPWIPRQRGTRIFQSAFVGLGNNPTEQELLAIGPGEIRGLENWSASCGEPMSLLVEPGEPLGALDSRSGPNILAHERAISSARWSPGDRLALRSKSFTINHRYLWIHAGGHGTRFNVVIEGFNIIRDPIYGGLKRSINHLNGQWYRIDLGMWQGKSAYIEFLDQFPHDQGDNDESPPDGFFWVDRVVLSNSDERAPLYSTRIQRSNPEPTTFVESAEMVEAEAKELLKDWIRKHNPAISFNRLNGFLQARLLGPPGPKRRPAIEKLQQRFHELETRISNPPCAPVAEDGNGLDEAVFVRGNHAKLGSVVPRRSLEALDGPKPLVIAQGSGRRELAEQWLSPKNPLVARVMVNRIWHHLFGRGLIPTPDNLGVLGVPPTHPELLDRLAMDFVGDGWSIKRLIRRLVLTRTYRMSSQPDAIHSERDPENKLLTRFSVKRLEGEVIWDTLLHLGGNLKQSMYGPSTLVHLDKNAEGRGKPPSGPIDGHGRRSIYLAVRRNYLSSMMMAFDTPVPASPVGKRSVSNVPAQALILLNDPFVLEQAKRWSAQSHSQCSMMDSTSRMKLLFCQATGRIPDRREIHAMDEFLQGMKSPRRSDARGEPNQADRSSEWDDICHALINLKEFVFVR
jgi:hypothetical protein